MSSSRLGETKRRIAFHPPPHRTSHISYTTRHPHPTKHRGTPAMSSPASRRSKRNSVNSTPARGSQPSQEQTSSQPANMEATGSQPDGAQSTPQAPRQNLASSSPLFFRSSPSNASQAGPQEGPSRGAMDISSPLKQVSNAGDEDRTPRASRQDPVAGVYFVKLVLIYCS